MRKIFVFFGNREFIVFILIGIFNTISGSVFSVIYSYNLNVNIAFVLGYITSLMIAYLLNSKFNFKKKLSVQRFIKFGISYVPNFISQNMFVLIFYNHLGWEEVVVYFLAALIGVPVTFICLKIFAFKNKGRS